MVFFTCNHCGSALKKNRVEKHYAMECRASPSLSCMDCSKDFYGDEYKTHTKCITEEQKYSGKPLDDTSSIGKGEKKQMQWVETVRNILETKGSTLSHQERGMLENMKDFDNIPRKKKKFENFVKNIMKRYVEQRTLDKVWALLEEHKPVAADSKGKVDKNVGEESEDKGLEEETSPDEIAGDENDLKPQKIEVGSKKKLKRNAIRADHDVGENEEQVSSKKKKRKATEDVEMLDGDCENVEAELNVDNAAAEGGEDSACTKEDIAKLSKKEKKERKKKEKYEAELKSVANGVNELADIVDETQDVKSKKKKKKNKNTEETADVGDGDASKIKEKRKHKESQNEDQPGENNKTEDAAAAEETVNGAGDVPKGKFKWEKTIVSALQAAPENELLIKRLRKKVLAEYQEWQSCTASHGMNSLEEALGTFDRKLHRIPSVKILKDRVKLLKISD